MAFGSSWVGTEPLPEHKEQDFFHSVILWTVFDSFSNTLTTQHAKYKWCAKHPAVWSECTPHMDYNWVNNSQSDIQCSILIQGKLFFHSLLPLNTTLHYVKTYKMLCGHFFFTFPLALLGHIMISSCYILPHSGAQETWASERQFIDFCLFHTKLQNSTIPVYLVCICMNVCKAARKMQFMRFSVCVFG